MAFADEVDFDGRLLWWGIEVCTAGDDFATVQYRWATMAGDVGGNHFQERLVSVGNIQRGLGNDHLPVASTVEVVIDNTDFVADFLANRATVETSVFKARFRILCGVATSAANVYQATIVTQQVGVFVCMDFPIRSAEAIKLSLADDSLGKLADLLVAPTLEDWHAGHNSTYDVFSGVQYATECEWLTDPTTPVPLQFGQSPYIGAGAYVWTRQPDTADFDTGSWPSGSRKFLFPIIVLATRDTATLSADDVGQLRGVYRQDSLQVESTASGFQPFASAYAGKTTFKIPETFVLTGTTSTRIWKAYKTPTITKNGYDWKLLWVAFHAENYAKWFSANHLRFINGFNGTSPSAVHAVTPVRWGDSKHASHGRDQFAAFDHFLIGGRYGSAVNGRSDTGYRNPVNIARDLCEWYSVLGTSGIDTNRFARAGSGRNMEARGAIASGGGAYENVAAQQLNTDIGPYGIGVLRRNLAELGRSSDMDIFVTMEGKAAVVVMAADFTSQTTTYPTIDEARINNVIDRTPSAGERWSPYNRVFLKCPDGVARGPFDDTAAITAWGRIISKALDAKWYDSPLVKSDNPVTSGDVETVRNQRFVEAKVRPVISFTTDVGILAIELGDYFTMSWTRGGQNSVYASTLWRLESVTINPEKGSVEVTAVWMDDLTTTQPFLLDNEALFLRVAGSGLRTCTVTDGSAAVTFASGSLITDGVADGDILRLRDTSEAATGFTRNRDVRIFRVTSATTLDLLASSDLDFGTAGAHVIAAADWKIVRGFRTYPNLADAPASYPSGSAMYGKISNSVGQFSDASAANQLLDG